MVGYKRKRRTARGSKKRARYSTAMTKSVKTPEVRLKMPFLWSTITFSSPPLLSECWWQIRPRLSNVPAVPRGEVTNLFDLYKINGFKVTLVPRFVDFDAGSDIANPVPNFTFNSDPYNIDAYLGGYNLATYQTFLERCTMSPRIATGDKVLVAYQNKPMMYDGTNTGEIKPFPWTSVNNTGIFAYGLDFFIHAPNFANFKNTTEFDIIVELDVSFKGRR